MSVSATHALRDQLFRSTESMDIAMLQTEVRKAVGANLGKGECEVLAKIVQDIRDGNIEVDELAAAWLDDRVERGPDGLGHRFEQAGQNAALGGALGTVTGAGLYALLTATAGPAVPGLLIAYMALVGGTMGGGILAPAMGIIGLFKD